MNSFILAYFINFNRTIHKRSKIFIKSVAISRKKHLRPVNVFFKLYAELSMMTLQTLFKVIYSLKVHNNKTSA